MKVNFDRTAQHNATRIMLTAVGLALQSEGYGPRRISRVIQRVQEYCEDNLDAYMRDDAIEKIKRDYNSVRVL